MRTQPHHPMEPLAPKYPSAIGGYAALAHAVASEGGYSLAEARQYIVAVIATLEAGLSFVDVSDLEDELPLELREILHGEPIVDVLSMDPTELYARVAARLQITREQGEPIARVVLRAVRAILPSKEVEHLEAQLTPRMRAMWRSGPFQARARLP